VHVFGPADPFRVTEGACGLYAGRRLFLFRYADAARAAAQLAAARQTLAQGNGYQVGPAGAAGFDATDADGNRILVRLAGDILEVRVELASPSGAS